jgi:hypothetical protein
LQKTSPQRGKEKAQIHVVVIKLNVPQKVSILLSI